MYSLTKPKARLKDVRSITISDFNTNKVLVHAYLQYFSTFNRRGTIIEKNVKLELRHANLKTVWGGAVYKNFTRT